ncbi:MAG: alanine--tRNA ligase [Planctomycetaceae bacterium]|nr:alanine--tRNA ligase [Planctomycetaceae bacterium]
MKTDELREKYLAFFESQGCVRRPSDVLVPKDDPTVLFTPAGMNQFKNQFLGIGPLDFTAATTCQKCLRTGDIDNVGVTAYHHTFFEMLGNFSFGDYFKREAIHWAWEFLTTKKWLGLDPTRLSVTVYLDDDEAFALWRDEIKLPIERISREDEYENFWPAGSPTNGPDGVCGPCSEIYYHPPTGGKKVEIWNLVFTQFNRVGAPPNNLRPLPKKNIDTGMGLERTAAVLQGFESNYEINTLRPICDAAGEIVGTKYDFTGPQGRPLRRIADHIRACAFAIHEGCLPGNEKENYVIRLLLRRASMEAFRLGRQEPCLSQLVPVIVEQMQRAYPELRQTVENVKHAIETEEKQFLGVVDRGIQKFRKLVEQSRSRNQKVVSGDEAFDLHQTDGFLIELTEDLADAEGMTVDRNRFEVCVLEHKAKSGSGAFADSVMSEGPLDALRKQGGTQFLGYETTSADAKIVGLLADKQLVTSCDRVGKSVGIVLDRTPFYGESGGQVGDTGWFVFEGGVFAVRDTQKNGDLFVHIGELQSGSLKVGAAVRAEVDTARREGIRRAHSATHLLHHALRKYLGENATQRGSKVEQDHLRFDFAHHKTVTDAELLQIEDEINARIAEGAPVNIAVMPLADAKQLGAMALFGEKYPDHVRVVTMGNFSREFCGGTHLSNTGQVGLCRIVKEELIAAGIRRVTCLTGPKALQRIRETEGLVDQLSGLLKASQPDELPRKVQLLQDELRQTKQELSKYTAQSLAATAKKLVEEAETVNGTKVVIHLADCPRESLKEFVDCIREQAPSVAVLLGLITEGKVALIAAVSKDLIAKKISASDAVKAAAKVAGGGGGGRPDLAEAGGKLPEKLSDALATGGEFFRGKLAAAS